MMSWFRYLLFLLACVSPLAFAGDWPQWRGQNRDGVAAGETGLLTKWSEKGPPLLWQAKGAGRGYSSVAVTAGKIYTLGDAPSTATDSDEYLLCFDDATGKQVWKTKLGSPYTHRNDSWGSSRSTPTVDGELLYVLTGNGDLICLETAAGKEVWRKNMQKDFGGRKGDGWGYSESVLVDGDKVICTPGGKTTMAALDKKTGKTVWTASLSGSPGAGHASIMPTDIGKTRVYVQTLQGAGVGVRASDGKIHWNIGKIKATAVIPTPVVRGDLVLLAAGYGLGGTLLRQVPDGADGVKVEEVYPLNKTLANKHGGIVLVGDYIYGDSSDGGPLFCVEFKTGKEMWKKRGSGSGSASVSAADGHLYIHHANGTMSLVKATPDDYTPVGSFKLPRSGNRPGWSHPVIANKKLYVREGDSIMCYDLQAR